ncbi:uncharacterized protein ms(2)34Fe isoform X2 [Drosophila pseudoobscura]|uniref:Uncharacterized protein ms(2)34Fe isoform X2 n=1 Tax=Drosophila pseudoobscura pseudoobscura TaxID=46245 RepID=A0A6I8UJ53_DROPS|nr:uncharacterized protein LOC4816590 isoform X2 [Drosophila pseudoobscura]
MNTARSSRRGNRPSVSDHAYHIYCVNFYDNGLSALRDEFIRRIKCGLRRSLFVIDVENEVQLAIQQQDLRISKAYSKRTGANELMSTDPVSITMQRIRESVAEYENISRNIDQELHFNLYEYWQKNSPAELKNISTDPNKERASRTKNTLDTMRTNATASRKTTKSKAEKGSSEMPKMEKIECVSVTAKDHHKVGKGKPLSKRMYINDNPLTTKIMILVIGHFDNDFYKSLLANHQPVRAIIHFLPEECAYDLLVPRPRRERYLQETIENIQKDIHSLRKRTATKRVGIFQQQLPQMSACLATKFTDDIFNQLSWFVYDLETLREQYVSYYLAPYQEINVKMSPDANMLDSFHMAESLSIQGHYLKSQMPAARADVGTIYLYVESLMSIFGNPRELMTEMEVLLLANPTSSAQTRMLDKVKVYANAFKSIVKLSKNERLFVEQGNSLLSSILSYMDQSLMTNVYHGCLEYNVMRRYFTSGYITESLPYSPYNGELEPIFLPKYAQLYLTDDAVTQRIIELVNDYDDITVEEVFPSVKLYTFRRALNEVFEQQKQTVLPTRLCFRDFTLFEMEQFLNDLVTPQMFDEAMEQNENLAMAHSIATMHGLENEPMIIKCKGGQRLSIDPHVFVRPQSLKAQIKDKEKEEHTPAIAANLESTRSTKSLRQSKTSLQAKFNLTGSGGTNIPYIGLGPNHPMLKGYNLDDTQQKIKSKTSTYFFEEGRITLYEEKWNFRQMNKCLSLNVDGHHVHFKGSAKSVGTTDGNIRVESKNGISLRVLLSDKECAKAVVNYPNGLSTYCHDTHAEHVWSIQENKLDESRRVCTPYGCVIVYYNNSSTVLIMRYNGEVYHLFSYTEAEVEEEEEAATEFINACSTQSTYSSYQPLSNEIKKRKSRDVRSSQNVRSSGGADSLSRPSVQSNTSKESSAARKQRLAKSKQAAVLFASIDFELKYLKFIMGLYNLSYKHLKLITSMGSVVHVQTDGKIWCGKPFKNTEWHDYYANESYSMRNDGVKVIWTKEETRCYHRDGTIIRTGTIEGWDPGVLVDEIDAEISSSSSHRALVRRTTKEVGVPPNPLYINIAEADPFGPVGQTSASSRGSLQSIATEVPRKMSIREYLVEEEGEEVIICDMSFITYVPDSYFLQHQLYAGIHFTFTHLTDVDLKIETEVLMCDNLKIRLYKAPQIEELNPAEVKEVSTVGDAAEHKLPAFQASQSSEADSDEWMKRRNHASISGGGSTQRPPPPPFESAMVDIEGINLRITVSEKQAVVTTRLRKFGCDENALVVREDITLQVDFDKNLSTTFRNWVEILTKFINCFCPKWRTVYFLESSSTECKRKGFELVRSIPPLGKYNFCAGNYFIDVNELMSINNRMKNDFDFYDSDMVKFPRFPLYKTGPQPIEFPMVLNAKIFVELPTQLANSDRIHHFINPFDRIKFRKLRHRFNESVLFHLHPRLRQLVQQEISKRSWANHHQEQQRRNLSEQQRLTLYLAMLKHKVYPNYFQFRDQFYYHIRNIDFFEFMAIKCSEKANPEHYREHIDETEEPTAPAAVPTKKKNKKCLCPKYVKSLQ